MISAHMTHAKFEQSHEVGFVISAQDYLVYLEGLPSARINDIITTKDGARAMVSALDEEKIEALMLDPQHPKPGDEFELASTGLKLPLHINLFGRVFNPLGIPLDGKAGFPPGTDIIDLDIIAPGIDKRDLVTEQFYTGIPVIDTLIPIGRGQRELIFGEARSGKSGFLLEIITHQKKYDVICIYVAIGKSELDIKRFAQSVAETGAAAYTIILAATSAESAPMISIAPAVGCSIAEHYRDAGKKVLLIFDDLATHAKYLREINLLSGRVPGRESYPADIFYQHSHLVERAGNFNKQLGGGSITLLPIIETDIESFTNLIPTNVMSQTDGHMLFSAALRAQGRYPAVDVDRSVTRVGRQTQIFSHKVLSDRIRLLLADFHELERFSRFGSELTADTQLKIKRGRVMEELLNHMQLTYTDASVQMMYLSLIYTGFYDNRDIEFVKVTKKIILQTLSENPAFTDLTGRIKDIDIDALIKELTDKLSILEDVCQQLVTSKKGGRIPEQ